MPNIDRRDDEMPTQSLLMRYQSPYPRKYAYAKPDNFEPSAFNRELKDLSGDGKITKKDVLIGRGVIDAPGNTKAPTKRFCGGMSKPYKRK